jgi:myosin-5
MRYTKEELVSMNHKTKYMFVPDKKMIYIPVKVISETDDDLNCITITNENKSINKKDIKSCHYITNLSALCQAPNNLIDGDMNEAMLLYSIQTRFSNTRWYSWMGPILLCVNPFTWTDGLYTKDVIQFYVDQRVQNKTRDVPPHVFAVAERAFMALAKRGPNGETSSLSIVVSGESGAGKTEAAKQSLLYLAAVSMSRRNNSGKNNGEEKQSGRGKKSRTLRSTRSMLAMGYSPGVQTGVVDKIISANPILEAFGNAKTTRNNNSSRFGKWLQVVYDDGLSILGSKNKTFLLEKSRVVFQATGEHNFHIFYFLLLGADNDIRNHLKLNDAHFDTWRYLQWSSKETPSNMNTYYKEMNDSFVSLGFTSNEIMNIYSLVAGILHLGNCKLMNETKTWMLSASELLNVDSDELELWTTRDETSVQKAGGASFTLKYLNVIEADGARDSASKAIYSKLFDWLVKRINNECLPKEAEEHSTNFIGLLDIFGFERFDSNGFDQLCINYCNERLQQVFCESTFNKELALYKDEGISKLPEVVVPTNQKVLDHVGGLFKILQDLIRAKYVSYFL